jgi:hypothetical protein
MNRDFPPKDLIVSVIQWLGRNVVLLIFLFERRREREPVFPMIVLYEKPGAYFRALS